MLSELSGFLNERSTWAAAVYPIGFIVYLALLVAISMAPIRHMPRLTLILGVVLVLYFVANWAGVALSANMARNGLAANGTVVRIILVDLWFGFLYWGFLSLIRTKRRP